jgi:hypothetical protein
MAGRFMRWIGSEIAGHAIVSGLTSGLHSIASAAIDSGASRVKEEIVKKVGKKEGRVEGMVLLSRAMFDVALDGPEHAGAQKVNEYYMHLDQHGRERMERLVGDSWFAMSDGIGAIRDLKEEKIVEEAKAGKKTTSRSFNPGSNPAIVFMKHWANIGALGDQFIELELEKIERTSTLRRISNATGNALAGLITGSMKGRNNG